jgi:hypothetical protein
MKEKLLQSYQEEVKKNKDDLDKEKIKLIKKIKQIKKEELFKKTEVKLTLWQKIKKVLGF